MANFYGSYIGYGGGSSGAGAAYYGESYSYVYGGYAHPAGGRTAGYDRNSFTSDGPSCDVGNMASGNPGRDSWAGNSSDTDAYQSGGYGPGAYSPNTANVIEKHTFASEGNCVDVGDLASLLNGSHRRDLSSASDRTNAYGYLFGGHRAASDPTGGSQQYKEIQRFSMVSSANGADVGDLTENQASAAGGTDLAGGYGYCGVGCNGGYSDIIQRFQFSATNDGVDVGDAVREACEVSGTSSLTHFYMAGHHEAVSGQLTPAGVDAIQKVQFVATANAAAVANLIKSRSASAGCTSKDYGYTHGGSFYGDAAIGTTDVGKYAFASDGDETDVGDLTVSIHSLGNVSTQY